MLSTTDTSDQADLQADLQGAALVGPMTTDPAPDPEIPPGHTALARTKVFIANVSPGNVATAFCRSLVEIIRADIDNQWGLWAGTIWTESGANICKGRNDAVRTFLDDHPDGEWLLWLDSDMVPPADIIPRLLVTAKHTRGKIIGGLCVMVQESGPIPTLYQYDQTPGSDGLTRVQFDYPENTVIQVAATGGACLLIHRSVLEEMRESEGHDFAWFREEVLYSPSGKPHYVSEDIAFCLRAGKLGHAVWVDCSLEVGHRKHGRTWMPSDIAKGVGIPEGDVVALVPMKDKRHLAMDLLAQIDQQGEAAEVVICDNGSESAATKDWLAGLREQGTLPHSGTKVTVLDMPEVGIHHMWNAGAAHAFRAY